MRAEKRGQMGEVFQGKTLLVLGSNVSADDIVRYAKSNGAYTIVADYYPVERSAAKRVADEAVLTSTADLEALGKLIESRKVDGVLAGVSEFNLKQAMALAERYHLPFYCTRKQWDQVEDKGNFRKLCIQNGVPCPKTYYCGEKIPDEIVDRISFPVLIKPVDCSSSAGVHICMNCAELQEAEKDAITYSGSGKVIVEQFVHGTEFTAHYTICNGVPKLSCIDNRYPVSIHEGNVTTIPAARIYPTLFLDAYLEQVDASMCRLCKALQIENGVLFVQGMYDEKDGFALFEGGMRSAGESPYRLLSAVNGVNYMEMLTETALLGHPVTFDAAREDPTLHGKCCGIVSFVAKGGVVGKIDGLEEAVSATPSVISYENRYPVGTTTPDTDTLRQLMIRFVMVCENRQQMVKDIDYLNRHITVLNEQGEDMVVKMNPEKILKI